MPDRTYCLGPYSITSRDFPGEEGSTFVDRNKTRLVVVISSCDAVLSLPSSDAILLHEIKNCPGGDCDIFWFECPSQMGRTYTILPTGCGAAVTSFENGFLANKTCDGAIFGSSEFCFGRIYAGGESLVSSNPCVTSFEFDGHVFIVQSEEADPNPLTTCDQCWESNMVIAFGGGTDPEDPGSGDLPTPPPPVENVNDPLEDEVVVQVEEENRVNWVVGLPGVTEATDTACFAEDTSISVLKEACESQDNPSIATLPSGHAVIAYEDRDEKGRTKITVALISTSVPSQIVYYRRLSFGRLINDNSFGVQGVGTFEIFDDILLDLTDNVPNPALQLGFLSGPLKGGTPFNIVSVVRDTSGTRPKLIVTFSSQGKAPDFDDANDAFNVSFFITKTTAGNPVGIELLDIPTQADTAGNHLQVAHPSVAVATNNIMIDSSQIIYVTYQVLEDSKWNIYLTQIRLVEKSSSNPQYLPPYTFASPQPVMRNISTIASTDSSVVYRLTQIVTASNVLCALFEVFLQDGRQVLNCNTSATGTTSTSCGLISENSIATVEVIYSLTLCDPDIPSELPDWSFGTEITDVYPPTAATIINGRGNADCVDAINPLPDTSQWCFNQSDCTQFFVFDDPYCPSPYFDILDFTYHPADMWQIKMGNNIVSRVLYNMSVTITQASQSAGLSQDLDFMFVIDHSGSMQQEINNVRIAIPKIAQELRAAGFDVRFGFVVYARNNTSPTVPADSISCDDGGQGPCSPGESSIIFDALQGDVSGLSSSEEPGFTRNETLLQDALGFWYPSIQPRCARAQHWSAVQFAADDSRFNWRSGSAKFMFLITDTDEEEVAGDNICGTYSDDKTIATQSLLDKGIQFINAQKQDGSKIDIFSDVSVTTGWEGEPSYDVDTQNYEVILQDISVTILSVLSGLRVLERDTGGYSPTFLNDAEVLITYNQDLLDIWTNERGQFKFIDRPPTLSSATKGLTQFPFPILSSQIFGVNTVHASGQPSNWVYWATTGDLSLSFPNVGVPDRSRADPILIATNSTRATVKVNHRNDVIIAYENFDLNIPQIHIKGTGDFHYNGIIGPKGSRQTRFYQSTDFGFFHEITLPGEGVNQICDFVIDKSDITHVVWQSSRDGYWEIYYANSHNIFEPVRVTKSKSRSAMPRIDIDDDGTVYVVYQDNRFGPFDIMLAFKDERRVLPLTQQDAYLASLRTGYQHFTNVLPIFISNPSEMVPDEGLLWGTKIASIDGNDTENFIFALEEPSTGVKTKGGNTSPNEFIAIAGSRKGEMYGITKENELFLLASPDEYLESGLDLDPVRFQKIGDIPLTVTPGIGALIGNDVFDESDGTIMNHAGQWSNVCSTVGPPTFEICIADPRHCGNAIVSCDMCSFSAPEPPQGSLCNNRIYAQVFQTPANTSDMSVVASVGWWPFDPDTGFSSLSFVYPITNLFARVQQNSIASGYELLIVEKITTALYGPHTLTIIIKVRTGNLYTDSSDLATIDIPSPFANDIPVDVRLDVFDEPDGSVTLKAYFNDILALSVNDNIFKHQGIWAGVGSKSGVRSEFQGASTQLRSFSIHEFIPPNDTDTSTIVDATVDVVGRLWVVAADTLVLGGGRLRVVELNTSTASITRDSIIFNDISELKGAITSLNDGTFYMVGYQQGKSILSKSGYPVIVESTANFSFSPINNDMTIRLDSMASDFEDTIFAINQDSNLYTISPQTGAATLVSDLTVDTSSPADLIADVSGLGYQFSGQFLPTGTAGFFNVLIEFYSNINLLGDPVVTVDSRDSLEAFINIQTQATLNDPYVEFASARGAFLSVGGSGFIFFDASHFRPGSSSLSYPFAFDTNQTYFPRVSTIRPAGDPVVVSEIQTVSFSCNRCTVLGTNMFNVEGCSFSWIIDSPGTYNFLVDFFADPNRTHRLARFSAQPNDSDLSLFEVNNKPAADEWGNAGLVVLDGQEQFLQVYPTLDPNSGLLCNVTYYVSILKCTEVGCLDTSVIEKGTFLCECSSLIFGDAASVPLSQVSRWQSSANGYSDTRVTDTAKNSMKPDVKTRSSGSALILFEDYSEPKSKIHAATFRKANQDELFGSGTRAWFDYDFNIQGQDADTTTDLLDRVVIAYERPDDPVGKGISSNELPGNAILSKTCDFAESGDQVDEKCDISSLESNVITNDDLIVSSIVKQILVKPEFVDYYTYNSSNQPTPVVRNCKIILQIWGTPEVIAFRIRNENEVVFSAWCPYSSEISEYFIEKDHVLSSDSGVKEVCVQALTYSGITAEFCVPIVADYSATIFETNLYSDQSFETVLPQFNGMFVAATNELNSETASINKVRTIYVELVPNRAVEESQVNYDVLQQGENDLLNLVATSTIANGQQVFRGEFIINREDDVFNKDGLARIQVKFPGSCVDTASFVAAENQFIPDRFNLMSPEVDAVTQEVDALADFRQGVSGRIGVGVTIRPDEDPYFIFGSHDFFLKKENPDQDGIPKLDDTGGGG